MAKGRHSAPKKASHSRGRRSRRSRAPIGIVLAVFVVVIAAGAGIVFAWHQMTAEQPAEVRTGEEVTVEVPDGASVQAIAQLLKENGVIATVSAFDDRVAELGHEGDLKSGTYRFTGGQDLDEIIADLVDGESGYWVTIPEGYTLKQISSRVEEATEGQVSAKKFYKTAHTRASDFVDSCPFLANCYKGSLEGFLFPETYRVSYNATAREVIEQMLAQFQSEVSQLDMSYAQSKNLDVYDVTTLASIVEKESRVSDDKAGIAGVFYNRLHAKMNLGSDVTTYYAVGKELTETLTKKDLASKSPYNTRLESNTGLPPGAICSPGIESLQAAANPQESDYLYFFWSESQNKTMFFETAEEFDAAWEKYGE